MFYFTTNCKEKPRQRISMKVTLCKQVMHHDYHKSRIIYFWHCESHNETQRAEKGRSSWRVMDDIRHYDSWISLTTDALEIWNLLSSLCDTFLTGSLIMLRMRRSDTQRKGCGPLWLWPVLLSMWQLVSDPGRDLVTEGNGRGQRH